MLQILAITYTNGRNLDQGSSIVGNGLQSMISPEKEEKHNFCMYLCEQRVTVGDR